MLKLNEKSYEKFTPDERIKLAIAAIARNDTQEVDRLWRNCQTKEYAARDLEYKERFTAFTLISARFYQFCSRYYYRILLIEALILQHETNLHHGCEDKENVQEELNKLLTNRQRLISSLKAVYEGLREFCEEVGLNAEDFIQSVNMEAECGIIHAYIELGVQMDEGFSEYCKKEFLKSWMF